MGRRKSFIHYVRVCTGSPARTNLGTSEKNEFNFEYCQSMGEVLIAFSRGIRKVLALQPIILVTNSVPRLKFFNPIANRFASFIEE